MFKRTHKKFDDDSSVRPSISSDFSNQLNLTKSEDSLANFKIYQQQYANMLKLSGLPMEESATDDLQEMDVGKAVEILRNFKEQSDAASQYFLMKYKLEKVINKHNPTRHLVELSIGKLPTKNSLKNKIKEDANNPLHFLNLALRYSLIVICGKWRSGTKFNCNAYYSFLVAFLLADDIELKNEIREMFEKIRPSLIRYTCGDVLFNQNTAELCSKLLNGIDLTSFDSHLNELRRSLWYFLTIRLPEKKVYQIDLILNTFNNLIETLSQSTTSTNNNNQTKTVFGLFDNNNNATLIATNDNQEIAHLQEELNNIDKEIARLQAIRAEKQGKLATLMSENNPGNSI